MFGNYTKCVFFFLLKRIKIQDKENEIQAKIIFVQV